jgi:hypothetical protein
LPPCHRHRRRTGFLRCRHAALPALDFPAPRIKEAPILPMAADVGRGKLARLKSRGPSCLADSPIHRHTRCPRSSRMKGLVPILFFAARSSRPARRPPGGERPRLKAGAFASEGPARIHPPRWRRCRGRKRSARVPPTTAHPAPAIIPCAAHTMPASPSRRGHRALYGGALLHGRQPRLGRFPKP